MSFDVTTDQNDILDYVENLVCKIVNGRIVGINRPGARLLGAADPTEITGRPLADFVAPLYQEAVIAFLDGEFDDDDELPIKMATVKGRAIEMKLRRLVSPGTGTASILVGQDVSALIRYGEGLLQSLRRFRDLVSTSLDLKAVCQWPRITYLNAAGARMLGASEPKEVVGAELIDFIHPNYRLLFEAGPEVLLEEDGVIPAKIVGVGGIEKDIQFTFEQVAGREPPEIMVEGRDITSHNKAVSALKDMIENLEEKVDERTAELRKEIAERKKAEEMIRYQANYDMLTGLPNRNLFFQTLPKNLSTSRTRDEKLGVMFIDLDGFKDVNDTLGHDAGDQLLIETGERLTGCVRPRDFVARLGGDEFTIILPDIEHAENAGHIAKRLIEDLKKPFDLKGRKAHISGSIGIAVFPDDSDDMEELLKAGDAAMYVAKNQGKANYQFFTGALRRKEAESQALGRALDRALELEEFSLLYLPKLSLRDRRVVGIEALLRWRSATLGLVNPDRFIPLLEEKGMISAVGDWVLGTAAADWRTLAERHDPSIKIAINLSARQLRTRNFANHLMEILDRVGLPPENVELEITETSVLTQRSRATDVLKDLADTGMGLVLDDFGTGYASLRYLQSLPIDAVKIDRTFVEHLTDETEDLAIARSIVSMAHGLNRLVVAEGVETEEQLDILEGIGCDQAQGYFFSPPLTPEKLEDFLLENKEGR